MGDRIIRFIAIIGLCTLVYYFSYDQGRRAQRSHTEKAIQNLRAKEKVIETLAVEVSRLKNKVANLEDQLKSGSSETAPSSETGQVASRILIRLGATRTLLNQQLVVACLNVDRSKKQATLRLNYIHEKKIEQVSPRLGETIEIKLPGKTHILLLDEIRATSVILKLLTNKK